MSKVPPSSITIEEAVARMINIENIPMDCQLIDYLAALAYEAEEQYEKAKKK